MGETDFEKKQEISKVLDLKEWLYFIAQKDGGDSDYYRLEMYSGVVEVRYCRRWLKDMFGHADGSTAQYIASIYGKY